MLADDLDDLDDLGLPSSVREVVAHRVARLGEPTGRALSFAAVIGRDFDLDVLTELTDTYDQLLPYADRFAFLSATEQHLRDALAMHERMGARFWTGRTRIDQAELSLTRRADGDVESARDHLDAAHQIADEYVLGGLQLRIDRLADRP